MRERSKAVFAHLGDSLRLSILAGVLVAIFSESIGRHAASAIGMLAGHGYSWIVAVILLSLGILAVLSPSRFVSVLESVRYFPFHFGIVVKTLLGITFYVLTCWLTHFLVQTPMISLCTVLLLLAFCLGALIPLWILARCFLAIKYWLTTSRKAKAKATTWWLDDRPLETAHESHFSQIEQAATRILDRLALDKKVSHHALPSIALIGSYGAGKTSICNMVRDLQEHRTHKGKRLSRVFFCRFEGWQFLSPEAAVRNLLEEVTHTILDFVDAPELWTVPQKYVDSLTEVPLAWIKSVIPWLGTSENPQDVASAIGGVLVRTNTRLVIFVDDFDRMEDDSLDAQKAVARALNQIQNLPNVQYVLTLGPRFTLGEQPIENRPSTDLLKLTRFQELVPELDREAVLRGIRGLRDTALKEDHFWYPWNRIDAKHDDPLHYNPIMRHIGLSQGFADMLTGLIKTPRVFKAVLRETTTAWEGGLRGELNWYDLILLNAIKAACPSVFEWIARDLSTFIGHPGFHRKIDTGDNSLLKAEAGELKGKIEKIVGGSDAILVELVTNVLTYLFPTFAARIEARPSPIEPPPGDQRISYSPSSGPANIERFFTGRTSPDEVSDQFILRFIRETTNRAGLDKEAFEKQFLSSEENIRKRMNKLVRFAGSLELSSALDICGCILDWASSLEHPEEYMDNYPRDIMPDITTLLKDCEDRRYKPGEVPEGPDPIETWLAERIQRCTPETAVLTILLVLYIFRGSVLSPDREPRWQKELAQELYRRFMEDKGPFRVAVRRNRYSLLWLLEGMSAHDRYESFRGLLTKQLLAEATADTTGLLKSRLIHVLVDDRHAAVSGEPPLESYEFQVNRDRNARLLDMDEVIATVRMWDPASFEDEVSRQAVLCFRQAYDLSSQ